MIALYQRKDTVSYRSTILFLRLSYIFDKKYVQGERKELDKPRMRITRLSDVRTKIWEQRTLLRLTIVSKHMIIRLTTSINTDGLPFFNESKINTGIFL